MLQLLFVISAALVGQLARLTGDLLKEFPEEEAKRLTEGEGAGEGMGEEEGEGGVVELSPPALPSIFPDGLRDLKLRLGSDSFLRRTAPWMGTGLLVALDNFNKLEKDVGRTREDRSTSKTLFNKRSAFFSEGLATKRSMLVNTVFTSTAPFTKR
jgi:hypothetical protein